MKLKDLLSTCMNQYYESKGLFKKNPLFRITLLFEEKSENILENDYILKADYYNDENYLLKYRQREVKYWKAYFNDITIEIEGHY